MNLILEVTQEDIEIGKHRAGEYNKCPVAIAIKRLGFTNVDVDEDRILLTNGQERLVFRTPKYVNHFIGDFDNGSEIRPFKCRLDIPRIAMKEDERKSLCSRGDLD